MSKKTLFIILGGMVLLIVACASVFSLAGYTIYKSPGFQTNLKEFKADQVMMNFEQLVAKAYPSRFVDAEIHDKHILMVSLLFPGFVEGDKAQQGGKAREIASFCKQSFPEMAGIDYIEVRLVYESSLPKRGNETFSYGFYTDGLESVDAEAEDAPGAAETASSPSTAPFTKWQGVPIMPGAYAMDLCEGLSCLFTVDQNMEDVENYYIDEMQALGWEYQAGTNDRSLVFEKAEKQLSISVARQDRSWEKTRVNIFFLP